MLHLNVIEDNYNYLNHLTIFTCFEFPFGVAPWFPNTHHWLADIRLQLIALHYMVILFQVPECSSSKTHHGL